MTKQIVLSIAIFFLGTSPALQAKFIDGIRAIVSQKPILHSEVVSLQKELKASPTLANFFGLKPAQLTYKNVLELLIEEQIIRTVLQDAQAPVKDEEVQKQISSIASQNKISVDQLRGSLGAEGISFDSYVRNIRLQLEKKAVFEREVRSSTSNVSEAELRAEFEKVVQGQKNVSLLVTKADAATIKRLKGAAAAVNSGKLSIAELKKDNQVDSLGWVDDRGIAPKFRKALAGKSTGQAAGPIVEGGMAHLLLVEGQRKGSDEQYNQMKDQIAARLSRSNLDDIFKSWIEQKKKDIHFVLNSAN